MNDHHRVEDVRFEGSEMRLAVDGQEMKVELGRVSRIVRDASERERNTYVISPSGYLGRHVRAKAYGLAFGIQGDRGRLAPL